MNLAAHTSRIFIVPHLHRWLRDGRYQHDGKSWPRPRQGIVGIAREFIENSPPLATERQHQSGAGEPPAFWIDRLEEPERTAVWGAAWGLPPAVAACHFATMCGR